MITIKLHDIEQAQNGPWLWATNKKISRKSSSINSDKPGFLGTSSFNIKEEAQEEIDQSLEKGDGTR